MAVKYYTYRKKVPKPKPGQHVAFKAGKGYYLAGKAEPAPHPKPRPKPKPKPTPQPHHSKGAEHRAAIVKFAHSLVGIKEVPTGSNDGPAVHRIQSSTGAYKAPWCVSTVQFEDEHIGLAPYADKTANAYYYADYAHNHGHVIVHPVAGCAVIYHVGLGHAGRVVAVNLDGSFLAVEGNEGDAVRLVHRNPHTIPCTFVLRPELRG